MRIAHVAAHVGGGVGSVLRSFFEVSKSYAVSNDLFCLDRCESNFSDLTTVARREDGLAFSGAGFVGDLEDYDVTLIHQWNHPLLARFLSDVKFPPSRLAVWSHNSGLFEPHVMPSYLVQCAEKVLFTSSCSTLAPNLAGSIRSAPGKFATVHSTRLLDDFIEVGASRLPRNRGLNLLYVGTVSDSKMHPEISWILAELSRSGFHVRILGGPGHAVLAKKVSDLGGGIEVFGKVSDVTGFYKNADVFIYPLRKEHYGTGEQVILEAMAAGLPVVAFDNPAERAILHDGGGFLVDTASEFVDVVKALGDHPKTCQRVSEIGMERVRTEFSAESMAEGLIRHLSELMASEKKVPPTPVCAGMGVNELAICALNSFFDGEDLVDRMALNPDLEVDVVFEKIEPFLSDRSQRPRWLDSGKGTPVHYLEYFPGSTGLAALVEKMRLASAG